MVTFFAAAELISEESVKMVAVNCMNCVLPQALSELIFSELCVLNLDHHSGLFCKYCRKCRIQILCGIQDQNKWSVVSSLTQNMPHKYRRNLSWFWKWLLMIPDKLFPLSGSRNQVNSVDCHQKVVCFTIYTIGQKITSGLRKLHMLPRLVCIALTCSGILFYTGVETLSNGNRQNKYNIKNKKGIVTKTQMAFSDSAWMYHLFPLHYKLM